MPNSPQSMVVCGNSGFIIKYILPYLGVLKVDVKITLGQRLLSPHKRAAQGNLIIAKKTL